MKKHPNGVKDTIYQTIPSFSYLNQDSIEITQEAFLNTIYVADFFFTSCPTICPVMHRNMLKVYEEFKDNKEIKLASFTIDPKHDKPSVLKTYADQMGIEGTQWEFLWGEKDSVYDLAKNHFLVSVVEDEKSPGGYIHEGWFVLIDKRKRIRGIYNGTIETEVDKLVNDISTLLKEYK